MPTCHPSPAGTPARERSAVPNSGATHVSAASDAENAASQRRDASGAPSTATRRAQASARADSWALRAHVTNRWSLRSSTSKPRRTQHDATRIAPSPTHVTQSHRICNPQSGGGCGARYVPSRAARSALLPVAGSGRTVSDLRVWVCCLDRRSWQPIPHQPRLDVRPGRENTEPQRYRPRRQT
jgi:hypothetical protein